MTAMEYKRTAVTRVRMIEMLVAEIDNQPDARRIHERSELISERLTLLNELYSQNDSSMSLS